MKKIFLITLLPFILFVFGCSSSSVTSGALSTEQGALNNVSTSTQIAKQTIDLYKSQMDSLVGKVTSINISYGVEMRSIKYNTLDGHNNEYVASGIVVSPINTGQKNPILVINHGTLFKKSDAPSVSELLNLSNFTINDIYKFSAILMAGAGYVVVLPDYHGLGTGQGDHPYMHEDTAAKAVVDAIRATKTINAEIEFSDKLFITGYSQGGFVTMAAHRAIQSLYSNIMTVTASAPAGGAYDLSGTMYDLILSDNEYSDPSYLLYVLNGYNQYYNLYSSPLDIVKEQYSSVLSLMFSGNHSGDEINLQLPKVPNQALNPTFLTLLKTDPLNKYKQVLKENDVYDWTPQTAMKLIHCNADQTVPFVNATIAHQKFVSNGSSVTSIIDPSPASNHSSCYIPSMLAAYEFFETLR